MSEPFAERLARAVIVLDGPCPHATGIAKSWAKRECDRCIGSALLDAGLRDLVAERDRLLEWQRQMVEKAADESLDGYRELGQKCATLEGERDAALAALREVQKNYRQWAALDYMARSNGAAAFLAEIKRAADAVLEGE